jgi:hypothetical protein
MLTTASPCIVADDADLTLHRHRTFPIVAEDDVEDDEFEEDDEEEYEDEEFDEIDDEEFDDEEDDEFDDEE